MAESKIEWTDFTFNPWIGCTKVSPACLNCYAERDFDIRRHVAAWGRNGSRVLTSEANWNLPRRWDRAAAQGGPRRVFCASLADVFEDWDSLMHGGSGSRPRSMTDARTDLFKLIDDTPNLIWLLLTKRPENIRRMWLPRWRPFNVWLGTSVESSEYLWRIDALKACGDMAAKLFLSCEPVVGPMPTIGEHLDGIDWLITGGESGPGARVADADWFRSLRDQSVSAGIPFFFKQWGEFDADGNRVGKKQAGRLLDGEQWDQTPTY